MKRTAHVLLVVVVLLGLFGAMPAAAQTPAPGAAGTQATAAAVAAPSTTTFAYYVLPGDTLNKIAARFRTTVVAILRANPSIKNANLIRVGQRLLIPLAPSGSFTNVKVALIAMGGGTGGSGTIGCGDGVVLVDRPVAPTTAVLTAAIRELLSIKQQFYGQSGLYNALYQSNLAVQSVTIVSGKATIRLTGQTRLGGECDDPRVIAQFERTAKQFSTVTSVEVFVNGVKLETLLSGKGI